MGWMHLLNHDLEEIGVTGDYPWDIFGDAIDEINKIYKDKWGREATVLELENAFDFVIGPIRDAQEKNS